MNQKFVVNLPDIGEGVVEGEVVEWLKNVGDLVGQDEPVVVVMTDKATVELPAPHPGTLSKQHYKVGEIAILDKPLYELEVVGLSLKEEAQEVKVEEKKREKKECSGPAIVEGKVKAAPATRQLAKLLGINLSDVTATGKEGEVTVEDVKRGLGTKAVLPPLYHFEEDIVEPLVGVRKLMAEAMCTSHQEIPHFTFFDMLDVEEMALEREKLRGDFERRGIKLTYMPFYIRALSESLKKIPYANGSLDMEGKKIILHQRQNIGIAMNAGHGLIVPVLKGVEKMDFEELVIAFEELKKRALESKLSSSDMKEGTVSLTNFGTLGGVGGTPIIPYPQTAIVGLGKISKEPAVVDDQIVIRRRQMVCYSFDHRLIDGAQAAQFSSCFIKNLESF